MNPLLLDGIVLAVIALCTFVSWRRGFARSLVGLIGAAAAFFVAMLYSEPIAQKTYDAMLSEGITTAVRTGVETYGMESFHAFTEKIDLILSQLPTLIANAVSSELNAGSLEEWYRSVVEANSGNVAAALADNIVAPIVTAMLHILVFCLLFLICSTAAKLLAGLFGGMRRVPLVGSVDGVLGGVFGAARGMLYVFVFAAVLWLLMKATNDGLPCLTQAQAEKTMIFRFFFQAVSRVGLPS